MCNLRSDTEKQALTQRSGLEIRKTLERLFHREAQSQGRSDFLGIVLGMERLPERFLPYKALPILEEGAPAEPL